MQNVIVKLICGAVSAVCFFVLYDTLFRKRIERYAYARGQTDAYQAIQTKLAAAQEEARCQSEASLRVMLGQVGEQAYMHAATTILRDLHARGVVPDDVLRHQMLLASRVSLSYRAASDDALYAGIVLTGRSGGAA